jgi:hypothetical protein
MFIVFYCWGILQFFERIIHMELVSGKSKFLIPAILIFSLNAAYFYNKKEKIERIYKKANLQLNKLDIGVILYILFSFFTFFYNLVKSKH